MYAKRLLSIGISALLCAGAISLAATPAGTSPRLTGPRSNDPCAALKSKWQRAQCESYHRSAPGDEYFGRQKLSYLGIDNTFHDVAIEAGAYTTNPGLISRVIFADEALRAWEQKYPGDPQLARSYFLAVQVFKKIYTPAAQQRAWLYMQHVVRIYPATYFAKVIRSDMKIGFTEHWFALPEFCPTPTPSPEPQSRGHVEMTPEPSPTPEITPSPTPQPGQPQVQIITPPCVVPPSPTPTPAPYVTETPPAVVPSPTPTGSPTASPTALPSVSPRAVLQRHSSH